MGNKWTKIVLNNNLCHVKIKRPKTDMKGEWARDQIEGRYW